MKRFPQLHDRIVEVVTNLLLRRLPSTNEMVTGFFFSSYEYNHTDSMTFKMSLYKRINNLKKLSSVSSLYCR